MRVGGKEDRNLRSKLEIDCARQKEDKRVCNYLIGEVTEFIDPFLAGGCVTQSMSLRQ